LGPPEVFAASARGGPPAAEAVPLPSTLGPKAAATAPAPIVFRTSLRPVSTDVVALVILDLPFFRVPPKLISVRHVRSCRGHGRRRRRIGRVRHIPGFARCVLGRAARLARAAPALITTADLRAAG